MIVLDTNVASELMRENTDPRVSEWADTIPRQSIWIAAVSIMELRYGILILPEGRRKEMLEAALESFLANDVEGRTLPLDKSAADESAAVIATHRLAGLGIERNDAMIAGIVRANRATLATRNLRHFRHCGIPLIDPWARPLQS